MVEVVIFVLGVEEQVLNRVSIQLRLQLHSHFLDGEAGLLSRVIQNIGHKFLHNFNFKLLTRTSFNFKSILKG
jgi:hypothetical protein